MNYMFYDDWSFNQVLNWCLEESVTTNAMFTNSGCSATTCAVYTVGTCHPPKFKANNANLKTAVDAWLSVH